MALNFLLKRTATASKRPVAASMAFGELDINYDSTTGGVFYKDSANVVTKIGPVEVGTTAPNATPVGSAGNSRGEQWLDTTNGILKTYNGTAFVNPVPNGSTTVVGILQLTDSISSTSTTTAATPNSVKTAYDLANAAVPKSSYTALGALVVGTGTSTIGTLAVGTNGQSLVADSACATGLKWGQSLAGYTCSATPFNTALGANAGDSVTTGTCNTVVGYNAGTAISGGLNNTFVGFSAGDGITSADNNTAVGSNALGNTGGNNNTAVGFCSGGGISSGGNNTMVGTCAGRNATTADNTTVLGFNALSGTHTGNGTVALGACALAVSTSGGCNTAVGCNAGLSVTSGAINTLVGFSAGSAITTGGSNTLVGRYTGTAALANNVVLSDGAGTIRFQSNSTGAISLGAGGAYGTAGQILVSGGSGAAPTWASSGAVAANYGSFVRTTTQTNTGGASGNAVSYDVISQANNFSVVSGTQITAAVAGTYQVMASLQVQKTDAGTDDINFWLKKNGVNEPNSAYNLTLRGSNAAQLGYINWVITLAAGEYVELWWWSPDVNARIFAEPAAAPYPAIPSSGFIIHPLGA